jgi:hypothetical protein
MLDCSFYVFSYYYDRDKRILTVHVFNIALVRLFGSLLSITRRLYQ